MYWHFRVRTNELGRKWVRILDVVEGQRLSPHTTWAELADGANSMDFSLECSAAQARRVGALLLRLPGVEAALWHELQKAVTAAEMMRLALALHVEKENCASDASLFGTLWDAAPAIYLRTNNSGQAEREHATEVRLRWSEQFLWIRFACPYLDLHLRQGSARLKTSTDGLWTHDVAEVFLGSPEEMPSRYQEFEVSPRGEWLDLQIEHQANGAFQGTPLRSRFVCTAHINELRRVWTAVMQVPLQPFFPEGAKAGNSLSVNFFRSQGPGPVELAWQPTRRLSFHRPSCFGTLLLL